MKIMLELGWWIAPSIITIVSFIVAHINSPNERGGSYNFNIAGIVYFGAATIISLLSWLIWALLR